MYGFSLSGEEKEDIRKLGEVARELDQLEKCQAWGEYLKHLAALQAEAEKAMAGALTGDVALKAATAFVVLKEAMGIIPATRRNIQAQIEAQGAGRMR